jgi:hypothetical protein
MFVQTAEYLKSEVDDALSNHNNKQDLTRIYTAYFYVTKGYASYTANTITVIILIYLLL